jgi:hypothetical protein
MGRGPAATIWASSRQPSLVGQSLQSGGCLHSGGIGLCIFHNRAWRRKASSTVVGVAEDPAGAGEKGGA